jgi:hypothetical protein
MYQISVTLEHIHPSIWRRIQVPADVTLFRLHEILQVVMGWENMHLYMFEVDDVHYSEPSPNWDVEDAERTTLSQVIPGEGFAFYYEYDMGDSWMHQVIVERELPGEPDVRYPVCISGERACPPEDCGGPPGYVELLEAIRSSSHERHEELLEWLGKPFDPEAFIVEAVNAALDAWGFRDS